MKVSLMHYSKYYLHRIFTKTTGVTIHAYLQRRRLTEAAKLLVFSNTSILEIALISGYESQQAFTERFKAMMFFGMYTIVDLFFVARFVDLNALSSIDKQRRAAF